MFSEETLSRFAPKSAVRTGRHDGHVKVTNIELFFDLVYVFSIIQLSHYLLDHQTWLGALEAVTIFAAIWWAWNYTAWAANWINPDHFAGRVLMIVLMGLALLMAVSIPYAFDGRGWLFVIAYVAMALIRAFYMAAVMRDSQMGQNYYQLGLWSALSGVFWIAGALIPSLRLPLWMIAVIVDYAAPYAGFWVPKDGKTPMESWTLEGHHLLERNQLIFIIALGESILLLGGTLVYKEELTVLSFVTAGLGFLTIVTLWWLYFVRSTAEGEEAFDETADHARLARAGLAYGHGIMVCGAIVVAVSIEEMIAHPTGHAHTPAIIIAAAGPVIFLIGNAIFRMTMARRVPLVYGLGVAGFVGVAALVYLTHASGLLLGAGVLAVLMALTWATAQGRRS